MSAKKDLPMTNLLFSPGNDLFATSNASAFLVPVQGTSSSVLMTSENLSGEEDSFVGQNNHQHLATSSLFSKESENSDPFLSMEPGSSKIFPSVESNAAGVITSQQAPRLFVPPSTMSSGSFEYSETPPSTHQSSLNMQPPLSISSQVPPPPPSNPYNIASTNRGSYSNSRYVVPDYSNVSLPASQLQNFPDLTAPVNKSDPPMCGPTPPLHPPTSGTPPGPPQSLTNFANSVPAPPTPESMYHPVSFHWCYSKEQTDAWFPFSFYDSEKLEDISKNDNRAECMLSTDGGRYDVYVQLRERSSVYWEEPKSQVRRCTWFAKADSDASYIPLDENLAEKLEKDYKQVVMTNDWHKQIDLENGEMIVIHNPQVIVHLIPDKSPDLTIGIPELQMKSRVIKRGIAETDLAKEIPENEIGSPDHVVFVCHGIGPVCDLRSRSIVECVDEFRAIQLRLLKSHFKNALESRQVKRVELLPIHWHRALHGDATGVDRDIRRLTLPSIQRLRHFTNETLLDILFYSSPVYCQTIAETIGSEINSLHQLFLSRNPDFKGCFSLAGHSLGSLMLFDLLCNQGTNASEQLNDDKRNQDGHEFSNTATISSIDCGISSPNSLTEENVSQSEDPEMTLDHLLEKLNLNNFKDKFEAEQMEMETLILCSEADLKDIGLPMGPRKKLIGYLKEQEKEKERKREAIAAKLIVKEPNAAVQANVSDSVRTNRLESVSGFMSSAMNVHVDFQQYDTGTGQPMVKYPHLKFNPLICFALGSPIGMFLTVRGISELGEDFCFPTCGKFFNIFHPYDPVAYRIEPLINPDFNLKPVQVPHYKGRKRMHLELRDSLGRMGAELKQGIINSVKKAMNSMQRFAQNHWQTKQATDKEVEEEVEKVTDQLMKEEAEKPNESDDTVSVTSEATQLDISLGKINEGRRIDYVLQERPLESFNDYLFAFQSHFCYWNSEDTVLLMVKEIYNSMEVFSDSQIEKQQQLAEKKQVLTPPRMQNYTAPPPMTPYSTN